MSFNTDRWSINESLLQSYRAIFISSQSLFISAAALTTDSWIHLAVIGIALFQLYIGFTVVGSRALIVDYHKYGILSRFPNVTERDYVHNLALRKEINSIVGISKNLRQTRFKIDILIPASFLIIWICFLINYFF